MQPASAHWLVRGSAPRRRPLAASIGRWAVPVAALGLASCGGVLDPRGPVGEGNKTILIDSLAIMLAIVLPTIAAVLGFAWWYRASNLRARYRPEFAYSGQLELIVWFIPLLTIMLLGGVAWVGSHDLDPAKRLSADRPPLEIQVVSLDWKWLFIYPEQQVASVNRLVIPVGAPVEFSLTSASVMNTFFIPQLGSMIYTMNGMAPRLNLQADHAGTYRGESGHYSGAGFSDMHFDVDAVPPDQFAAWVEASRKDGPALDRQSYAELARQSSRVVPFTYREIDPGLFQAIVTQAVPPGPGPAAAAGGGAQPAEN
jgi:cytochrome o ubiquinol oxidase subunit 2